MRISGGNDQGNRSQSGFDRLAQQEARKAEKQDQREARRAERKEARQEREIAREAARSERQEKREAMRPAPRPIPVEPDGGIGDGAGPIPFPPEATTLAIGEEDGGGGSFPNDPDGPFPIGGKPIPVEPDGGIGDGAGPIPIDGQPMPVEPDGGIGDGAGPIPFPPEATTLAVGEEDGGGGPFPEDPDGPFPIGGSPMPVEPGGGIGDGAGPIPIGGQPIPVEPDGGIGDGAGPIPIGPTTPIDGPSRGGGLLFLYSLGPNSIGATNVTLNTDGAGTITGPGVDLTLSGGGYNAEGSWVASAGKGSINGDAVTLEQNPDGNAFVASGPGGLADQVSAWISGGRELTAKVIAVAQP